MPIFSEARTAYDGIIQLAGNPYSYSASSSGTAITGTATESKIAATIASNNACMIAARASIEKILPPNSAMPSDLEISESISYVTTSVKVFEKIPRLPNAKGVSEE
jgi:hypothetical protein